MCVYGAVKIYMNAEEVKEVMTLFLFYTVICNLRGGNIFKDYATTGTRFKKWENIASFL